MADMDHCIGSGQSNSTDIGCIDLFGCQGLFALFRLNLLWICSNTIKDCRLSIYHLFVAELIVIPV